MSFEFMFTIANILFTIGTVLLFRRVVKNRTMLKDFDLYGSLLTTIALFCMLVAYLDIQIYLPLLFALPTTLFWLFVSVYTLVYR